MGEVDAMPSCSKPNDVVETVHVISFQPGFHVHTSTNYSLLFPQNYNHLANLVMYQQQGCYIFFIQTQNCLILFSTDHNYQLETEMILIYTTQDQAKMEKKMCNNNAKSTQILSACLLPSIFLFLFPSHPYIHSNIHTPSHMTVQFEDVVLKKKEKGKAVLKLSNALTQSHRNWISFLPLRKNVDMHINCIQKRK